MCHFLPVHHLGIAFLGWVEGKNITRWQIVLFDQKHHSVPESSWQWWQCKGTLHSPKFNHYWRLTIRLFNIISRHQFGGIIFICKDAVDLFYSPSRLNSGRERETHWKQGINGKNRGKIILGLEDYTKNREERLSTVTRIYTKKDQQKQETEMARKTTVMIFQTSNCQNPT